MSISLIVAIVSLVAWIVLAFVVPVTAGAVHALLAVGTTALVRWWGTTR